MKIKIGIFFLVALLTGCSNSSDSPIPSTSSTISKSPSATQALTKVKLYFVSDTGTSLRLYSEVHSVADPKGDATEAAVSAVISGIKPLDPDYVNLWQSDSKLNSLTIAGDLATVDLHIGTLNVGSESEMRAIEQILFTLAANNASIKNVEFLKDGAVTESFAGHVDTYNTFQIDEGYLSLATIDLDVEEGDVLKRPYIVTGLACTFEANVPWELKQGELLVSSGTTTSKLACPDRSVFTFDLGNLVPGEYQIRVWESSMKDGSLINEDTKKIKIE